MFASGFTHPNLKVMKNTQTMKKLILTWAIVAMGSLTLLNAQAPGAGFDVSKISIGRLYGKVVDEAGNAVGFANVQLYGKAFNPATRTLKDTLLMGQLTQPNGEFNLEKLPIIGEFDLVISFLGYAESRQKVDFGMKMPPMPAEGSRPQMPAGGPAAGGFPGAAMAGAKFEKDLGKIALEAKSTTLDEVTITGQASVTTLGIDRRSFRVDQDLTAAGGTAQDALRNVPSVSVDLEGNVSLRNGSPLIFIDGRQSTLSLNQINAADIERIEVITNPSAKFDAGGGAGGIINIVMKKNLKLGYNGNVRLGGDSRGGLNFGGDLNARDGKINLFASANVNQNRGLSTSETQRENLFTQPLSSLTQTSTGVMQGVFGMGRAGIDYFIDNHNTLTLSASYMHGAFNPSDELTTTTLISGATPSSSTYVRNSDQDRQFQNVGVSAQFKHLFTKPGAEWTADLNYNQVNFLGSSQFVTRFEQGNTSEEKQENDGFGSFLTFQTDYVNPVTDRIKIETGIKGVLRSNTSSNASFVFDESLTDWRRISQLSDNYEFSDNVFAAYLQGAYSYGKWGVQAGLRSESSFYNGTLVDADSSFSINYPLSLFPSLFVSRKLNDGGDQLQFSYTRRVNRPNFFQTMPFTDFSDSLNLRRGNVALRPEFTNSLEVSYQNMLGKNHNLLVSAYFKQATNLIATYQFTEYNEQLGREAVITSYANASSAFAYGAEFTLKNSFFGWLDLTTNVNVFQAQVDASNVETALEVDRLSAFIKETVQIKLPKDFSLQLNGEYRTRASFTPSNNNDPFSGGGPSMNTAQGYAISNWFVDASVRKSFLKNQASLTLSVQDIFRSRYFGSYTYSDFFTQDFNRIMNPQLVRLNFSYRFGKMDMSLFTRKNNRMNMQGTDMM